MQIHIGQAIRRRLDESGHSVVWFARQLSVSRSNVYILFEKRSIDTNILLRISLLLDFDFFSLYSHKLKEDKITPP